MWPYNNNKLCFLLINLSLSINHPLLSFLLITFDIFLSFSHHSLEVSFCLFHNPVLLVLEHPLKVLSPVDVYSAYCKYVNIYVRVPFRYVCLSGRSNHTKQLCPLYLSVQASGKDFQFEILPHEEWLETFPYDKRSVMHYRRDNRMKARTEVCLNSTYESPNLTSTLDLLLLLV